MGFVLKYVLEYGSGRLSYRRAFPQSLRPYVAGQVRELKVSLGHKSSPEIARAYAEACERYERMCADASRRASGKFDRLDEAAISLVVASYKHNSLHDDEEERRDPSKNELYQALLLDVMSMEAARFEQKHAADPRGRWSSKQTDTCVEMRDHYRALRGRGDIDAIVELWQWEALQLCEDAGLVVDPDDGGSVVKLCWALNDAGIEVTELLLQRFSGDHVVTPPDPLASLNEENGAALEPAPLPEGVGASAVAPTGPNDHLDLLDLYNAYATDVQVKPQTLKEGRGHIENFCKHSGERNAHRITEEMVFNWREALLGEVRPNGSVRNPLTVRKYISTLSACLSWAVGERKIKLNVAASIPVRAPKKAKLRDRGFTDDEAARILRATLNTDTGQLSAGHANARRWIPWICAYTGARVNEISQLRSEDVVEVDGIWCIKITPEAGTVKTNEARSVPLHEHMVAQGFVAFAKSVGRGPLFYDLSSQRVGGEFNRHVKKVGERLATWVRKEVGIVDREIKPNHAWRHRFKTIAYDCGIEERVADAIQGHAPKSVGQAYGSVSVKAMAEAIGRIPRIVFSVGGVATQGEGSL